MNLLNLIRKLWATEPTLVITVLAAAVVFVAAKAGIVVDQTSLAKALAYVVPILIGGGIIRSQVSPTKS